MKLVKIPFSGGSLGKNIGCEFAPERIIELLRDFDLSEDKRFFSFLVDKVDIDKNDFEATQQNIYEKASKLFEGKERVVFLGGDHSITVPLFKAFSERYQNAGLIVFDSHADATTHTDLPTHEDLLSSLIGSGSLNPENVILVGLRTVWKDEEDFLNEHKIKRYTMKNISYENLQDVADSIMETARNFDALYISFDIDVVDPAFAPGTGYLEPAGLSSREIIYFIHRLKNLPNIKAIDLVEVNPEKDIQDMTSKLAAKMILEMF